MLVILYKIYINVVPFLRGGIKSIINSLFRCNIRLKIGTRISTNTDWLLFPGCSLHCGNNLIVGRDTIISISSGATVEIGENVGIGSRCQIVCHKKIVIGKGVSIGPNVMIYDHNHKYNGVNGVDQRSFEDGEIIVGDNCWIGAGCILLKDVHIGKNCIIGAGSVVTKNIPENSLAVGSPAKVIKKLG